MKSNFELESAMFTLKAQRVLSVEEAAKIFDVEPEEIIGLVEQYNDRFPVGYIYKVKKDEKESVVFAEKGMYMLSALVKSPKAKEKCIDMVESYKVLMDFADEMFSALEHARNGEFKKDDFKRKVISVSDNENEMPEEYDVVDGDKSPEDKDTQGED